MTAEALELPYREGKPNLTIMPRFASVAGREIDFCRRIHHLGAPLLFD
jgi:hypothetical protein